MTDHAREAAERIENTCCSLDGGIGEAKLAAISTRAESAEAALAEAQARAERAANPMAAFADAGWEFHYDEATRFVGASHALGGAFSICEVARFMRGGGEKPVTFHEVGHAIAAWLNQKSQADQAAAGGARE